MEQQVNKGLKLLSDYIFYKNYSQKKADGSLETWEESVDRIYSMHRNFLISKGYSPSFIDPILKEAKEAEKNKLFLSSQRGRQFASPKFDEGILKHNSKSYNCSMFLVNEPRVFKEAMYLLLSGVGVGFSVVKHIVAKLPPIADKVYESNTIYSIPDSIEGWADAIDHLMNAAFTNGMLPQFDYGQIRSKGELINDKFKAPGPEPLKECIENIKTLLKEAQGRNLRPIEAHRIICFIAQSVLAGGIRRCLPEGSMVHTRYGMIPIEDIEIGTEVLTSNGYRKVLNTFDQGVQSLVRIKTQDSYFDCTPNHRMAVLTGIDTYEWKEAQDLEEGDRLIAPSEALEGQEVNLPYFFYTKPSHSTTCKDIIIPTLTEEIAWFLGYIQGNGYIRLSSGKGTVSISFPKNYPELEFKLQKCFSLFSVNVSVIEYDNYKVIRTESKQLATYLYQWLKQPNVELRVPIFLWNATTNIKQGYLQGVMDADESVKTRPQILVVTVYENWARELQLLSSSCGIQIRMSLCNTAGLKENWKPKYQLSLINSKAKEFFREGSKKAIITDTERRTNSYPKEFLTFPYHSNYPWSKTEGKLIPVSVIAVEYLEGEYKTYDIEVEDNHEFFCNGLLTHNSATLSLFSKDDEEMLSCKTGDWYNTNRELAMANNSVHIPYSEHTTLEDYKKIFKYIKEYGEPGIIRTNDYNIGVNP